MSNDVCFNPRHQPPPTAGRLCEGFSYLPTRRQGHEKEDAQTGERLTVDSIECGTVAMEEKPPQESLRRTLLLQMSKLAGNRSPPTRARQHRGSISHVPKKFSGNASFPEATPDGPPDDDNDALRPNRVKHRRSGSVGRQEDSSIDTQRSSTPKTLSPPQNPVSPPATPPLPLPTLRKATRRNRMLSLGRRRPRSFLPLRPPLGSPPPRRCLP
jgi:hypothetical protein